MFKSRGLLGMTILLAGGSTSSACGTAEETTPRSDESIAQVSTALHSASDSRPWWKNAVGAASGYNLHLDNSVRFTHLQPGSDAANGQALFGLAADGVSEDKSEALFQGQSQVAQKEIVSNTRTCFTCHRGPAHDFGMPTPPATSVDSNDALFTGIQADANGDPDAPHNLEQLGLFKYRPNRFNPQLPKTDPFRQVFFWRKSPALVNVAFNHSMLNDGRGPTMFDAARGAVFSHTQTGDERFDDLFSVQQGSDIEAFLNGQLSDPALAPLLDPAHPEHEALVQDPFLTVAIETEAQQRGAKVFQRQCMTCHNIPNVFGNLAHVMPQGNGDRPVNYPSFGPGLGKAFNIGVAERNKHDLRFTVATGDGNFEPLVLSMADNDGTVVELTVDQDLGLAATTRRMVDVGRFKVPQLRNLTKHAPYFHDNSETTIEGVVDYFLSEFYASSPAGRRHPIEMDTKERADLIEFLRVL